jgi:hypothetical protein
MIVKKKGLWSDKDLIPWLTDWVTSASYSISRNHNILAYEKKGIAITGASV